MIYESIILEKENGVAVVTLNKPERRNAWSYQMRDEVTHALKDITGDNDIRVLIITGAGNSFCSGADVTNLIAVGVEKNDIDFLPLENNVVWIAAQLRNMKIPVIAAVNGHALGLGFALALAADIRIASENAVFAMTFIKRGIAPDTGITYFLPRLVGTARACELAFTGDSMTAGEADRIGLVNKVVPLEQLEETTLDWCRKMLEKSPIALRMLKAAFNAELDGQAGIQQLAGDATLLYYLSDEAKEGKEAFIEKRKPDFSKFPKFP